MRLPTFFSVRRVVLFVFGLTLAAWEIVYRFGNDEAVLVFLAMTLGFTPAKNLDVLLRKTQAPQIPAPDPDPPPQRPVTDRAEETAP